MRWLWPRIEPVCCLPVRTWSPRESIHILQEHNVRPWPLGNIFGIVPDLLHRETMGLEGVVYLYHNMTPPPNSGYSWVVFWGVVPNFAFNKVVPPWIWTKLFRHATQKLEEKVQEHDEVVESSRTDCRSQSRAMAKHASKCLYWSATPVPAVSCAQLPFGGFSLLSMNKITPPNIYQYTSCRNTKCGLEH